MGRKRGVRRKRGLEDGQGGLERRGVGTEKGSGESHAFQYCQLETLYTTVVRCMHWCPVVYEQHPAVVCGFRLTGLIYGDFPWEVPSNTAAMARVTATCDTAAVRLAGTLATRRPGIVRCFVVYPTQTPCFHSVPLVRRLVAGVCGTGMRCALASNKAFASLSPARRP